MKGLILALFAVVALVVLSVPVVACDTYAGGSTFSIVQQPIVAEVQQPVYTQAIVQPVYQQSVILRDSVGYGYGGRSLNVVVGGHRHGFESVRVRRRF